MFCQDSPVSVVHANRFISLVYNWTTIASFMPYVPPLLNCMTNEMFWSKIVVLIGAAQGKIFSGSRKFEDKFSCSVLYARVYKIHVFVYGGGVGKN